jgi:hypothetical protein
MSLSEHDEARKTNELRLQRTEHNADSRLLQFLGGKEILNNNYPMLTLKL